MNKRHRILAGAVVLALPISLVAATQTAAFAKKAKPPPDPARNCSLSGTVHFAPPGLSKNGTLTSNSAYKKTYTTTSGTNFGGGCTGSIPTVTIKSKSIKCKGLNNPQAPCKTKGTWWYDGESTFASGSTLTTITKSIKKITFGLDGVTYQTKTTAAAELVCSNGDVGFKISGVVKKPKQDKGQTSTVDVCLGSDTGPGTTGNFLSDLGSGIGTIATAQIDPSAGGSTVHIS